MLWKGQYSNLLPYLKNDVVYNEGIVWVKTTGPTGPIDFTSENYDSITYNELITGFIKTLNEQFVYEGFTSNESPYFENLDEISSILSDDLVSVGNNLKTCDQNINVFNIDGAQNFYSKTFYPYSNRLFFHSPQKMPSTIEVFLEGAGYRILSIDGLRSSNANVITQSFLNVSRSRFSSDSLIEFLPNSSVVQYGTPDVVSTLSDSFFGGSEVSLQGSSRINSCDFQNSTVKIGDAGPNSPIGTDFYNYVVHYFDDCRFIDSTLELTYTGKYQNVTIIFNRCFISDSRENVPDVGFIFPNRPPEFTVGNQNSIRVNLIIIDSSISCDKSYFNFIAGSNMMVLGTSVMPSLVAPIFDIAGFPSGKISQDIELNKFMQLQNSYSLVNPRSTTNFYYNQ